MTIIGTDGQSTVPYVVPAVSPALLQAIQGVRDLRLKVPLSLRF